MNSKVKPLKMGVSVGIGSHVDLIMTIFESCNNFQVTHWKACIKRNVGFWLSNLIIESVKNNILSLLLDGLLVGAFSDWMVNERTVPYIFNGLNFQPDRF